MTKLLDIDDPQYLEWASRLRSASTTMTRSEFFAFLNRSIRDLLSDCQVTEALDQQIRQDFETAFARTVQRWIHVDYVNQPDCGVSIKYSLKS